ncbi:MAG TPA: hypothetical protein VFY93_08860 [Planctomycetota bacterium]|nr:hypothetical protein [Planctomycetota bacterium]
MRTNTWVAACVVLAGLGGTIRAGEPDKSPKPSICTAKPQVKVGKVKVADGKVAVELKLSGTLASAPKSDETLSPVANIKAFLLWKKAGGKWEHLELPNQEVALGQLKGGSSLKIEKDVDSPAAAAVAESGEVEYELHLFMVGEACKMTPVAHFVSFKVTFDTTPTPGAAKLGSYAKKKSPDKKPVLVSDATGAGWMDDPEGKPYLPASPS